MILNKCDESWNENHVNGGGRIACFRGVQGHMNECSFPFFRLFRHIGTMVDQGCAADQTARLPSLIFHGCDRKTLGKILSSGLEIGHQKSGSGSHHPRSSHRRCIHFSLIDPRYDDKRPHIQAMAGPKCVDRRPYPGRHVFL